jgi:hypothetical protein
VQLSQDNAGLPESESTLPCSPESATGRRSATGLGVLPSKRRSVGQAYTLLTSSAHPFVSDLIFEVVHVVNINFLALIMSGRE